MFPVTTIHYLVLSAALLLIGTAGVLMRPAGSAGRPLGAGPAGHQGLMLIHLKGM